MSLYTSTFSVAGMSSSSTTSHHNSNLNTWGNSNTGSSSSSGLGGLGGLGSSTLSLGGSTTFGDSLSSTSRSFYQPGYLMSASQAHASPQGNQRVDELPVVQTKAKINQALLRGSTNDFGMDSMFESTSRQRQPLADEDAPPTQSVNDIPNESLSNHFQTRSSPTQQSLFSSHRTHTPPIPRSTTTTSSSPPIYVIVFGYPGDKYSITVDYFKSLGDSTDADPNTEIVNCFRIGYHDVGDAMRAVRKNGEILGGSWMVGAKWADPAQAEALLGQPIHRAGGISTTSLPREDSSNAMVVDEPSSASAVPMVGTPIRLAPSAAAFRRTGVTTTPKAVTPQPKAVAPFAFPAAASGNPSPSKGLVGQVSDLIFGW